MLKTRDDRGWPNPLWPFSKETRRVHNMHTRIRSNNVYFISQACCLFVWLKAWLGAEFSELKASHEISRLPPCAMASTSSFLGHCLMVAPNNALLLPISLNSAATNIVVHLVLPPGTVSAQSHLRSRLGCTFSCCSRQDDGLNPLRSYILTMAAPTTPPTHSHSFSLSDSTENGCYKSLHRSVTRIGRKSDIWWLAVDMRG
jgi:hypothetical protein